MTLIILSARSKTFKTHKFQPIGVQNMKTSFTGRQINARATTNSRSAVTSRFIVRAEGSELAKVERVQKAGGLYANFASEQSLTYLNGTLPGGTFSSIPTKQS